jgi:glycosyltransferase involved in cell wall biosynthesis
MDAEHVGSRHSRHETPSENVRRLTMRIVLALGWFFPDSMGGTEVYVAALADRYAGAGHDVLIAAPQAGLAGPREYTHDGHRVFRYPVPSLPTRREARGDVAVRGAEYFHAWLSAVRPDIVHVNSLVTGLGVHEIAAARQSGARIIYTNHLPSFGFVCARGTLMRWGTEACNGVREPRACSACLLEQRGVPRPIASTIARLEPRWLARAARPWESRLGTGLALPALVEQNGRRQEELLRLVDRVVVLSDWGAEIMHANGAAPERVVVNKLGISREHARVKAPVDLVPTTAPVTVGYIGRYNLVKGLREFAEAILRIDAALPLQFVFMGPVCSAGEQAVYDEIRATLADQPRVSFRDGIPAAHVPDALAALDVLCAPSVWFENGPTIALEALAVGTPVIGTRLGAFPENVADDVEGRLIAPADVGALVRVLTEIGETPSLVDRWRRGIRPVRTMTMCANDYLALYQRLAA